MSELWDKVYRLDVGDDSEILRIDGFGNNAAQITFNVSTHADSYIQVAEISVYGLSEENRRKLYEQYSKVRLVAGYRTQFGEIFSGNIYNVAIGRDGPEVFVTMYCRAHGLTWSNARINKSWGENTPAVEVIREVAETFEFPVEMVGDFSDLPPLITGLTMSQDSKSAMRALANNYSFSWSLENGQMVVARLGAKREGQASMHTISAATGMVGSPRVREYGIDVTSKMITQIRQYDEVEVINTTSELLFNNPTAPGRFPDTIGAGIYVVRGLSYIGDYHGETWDTIIEGWNPRVRQLSRTGQ